MSTTSSQVRRERAAIEPTSLDEAVDLLIAHASGNRTSESTPVAEVDRLAGRVRAEVRGLQSMQGELTEALIASQDRIHAMKTLAQINVQGAASDETIGLLLDEALALTSSFLVVLFTERTVRATAGDTARLDACTETARRSLAAAPGQLLRTTDGDHAVIATLDPEGEGGNFIGFYRRTGQPFSTVDLPIVDAIVSALGVMIAFNELHRYELERAAVEREHQLASALAQSVIIEQPPRSSAVEVFASTTPASLTGGDFYVFGKTQNSIWFAVGDVAGKGLPAAMLMTRAVAACRVAFLAHSEASVVDVFGRVEDELYEHLDEVGMFITLALGVVDERSRSISLVNAGHSPIVAVRASGVEPVAATVPPLGVIRGRVPTVSTVDLDLGHWLILGSDGLTEQADPNGNLFGYDRFDQLCHRLYLERSSAVGESILDAVHAFAAGSTASDDCTLVIFKNSSTPA
ncbi:PP2C family protein-serine/threonine phosphatase [Rhodococcus sp. KRD162]|uniref:PP2C family protein-serine/threonine phosphatase n=1 Tax=Rhodococcus sp. KRD162 TaxID=2729725 RepID=UPI0019D099A1|nr:PP2C family protein-serine/threonine phosphatase [Rhodococcus sp. KRD162]